MEMGDLTPKSISSTIKSRIRHTPKLAILAISGVLVLTPFWTPIGSVFDRRVQRVSRPGVLLGANIAFSGLFGHWPQIGC